MSVELLISYLKCRSKTLAPGTYKPMILLFLWVI